MILKSKLVLKHRIADIKATWQLITTLQKSKEDFEKYKQSIYELKNKEFIDKYNKTECLINHDHNSTFVFVNDTLDKIDENVEIESEKSSVNCLID